jgi:hypothetical protein
MQETFSEHAYLSREEPVELPDQRNPFFCGGLHDSHPFQKKSINNT